MAGGRSKHTRYRDTRKLDGETVLLLDDTWTAGGHAQSAAHTLLAAGASKVALVVIGRHVSVNSTYQVEPGKTVGDVLDALPKRGHAQCTSMPDDADKKSGLWGFAFICGLIGRSSIVFSDSSAANLFAEGAGLLLSVAVALAVVEEVQKRARSARYAELVWTVTQTALERLEDAGGNLAVAAESVGPRQSFRTGLSTRGGTRTGRSCSGADGPRRRRRSGT